MALDLLLCLAGFLLLWFGADWLVKGASSLAKSMGISPIVIGLTVVAFGTSAPEFVVSVHSSFSGKSMMAVGNVLGSNICNMALVLGVCALFTPVTASRRVARFEMPLMLVISVGVFALARDGALDRRDGGILLGGIVLYTLLQYLTARRRGDRTPDAVEKIGFVATRGAQVLLLVVGVAGVVGGARLVVDSAVRIMTELGVGERFVGLTIVAFGTSLPELATSVVAAARREMDISIGNLVGSNVFNLLSVLGASALVREIPIPGGLGGGGLPVDFAVMLLTSALPLLLMVRRRTVGRAGGLLLVATYAAYVGWLVAGRGT